MTGTILKIKQYAAVPLVALVASGAAMTIGCSNMATTATSTSDAFGNSAVMTGKVHGGNQPVYNATVQLYTVGFNGPGSAGTLLATTTTNAAGGFSFNKQATGSYSNTTNTYVCPSGLDPIVYLKTTGGNTVGNGNASVNNSAAAFIAPVGLCSTIGASTFVNISEVTTAATVVAMAQFINPSTDLIGADGINVEYIAVQNQFKTVATLVNANSGLANTSVAVPGSTSGLQTSNVTMYVTPESAKLNTVANILSACVNQVSATSGTNCNTLFANATAPSTAGIARGSQPNATYPAATDTIQAALYMFLRPTDGSQTNRTALFNLSPANGAPYQPTITALPTDWTIGVTYQSNNTCGTSNSTFFSFASEINVDVNGNLWVSNNNTGSANNGSLSEFASNGTPLACASNIAKGFAGGTVDAEGDVWVGDSAANFIYRLTVPGSTQVTTSNPAYTVRTYTTAGPVLAITADGADNVYFTTTTNTTNGTGSLYLIQSGAKISGVNAPTLISNTVGPNPQHIFPDKAGDIFVTSGAGYITEVSTSTSTQASNGYLSTQITGIPSPTVGVVVGSDYRVFVTSADPGATLSVLSPTSGNGYQLTATTPANSGGLSNPQGVFLDGGQTSYVVNGTANSSTGLYGLSVVSVAGTTVNEVSATGNANGGYQKSLQYFNGMHNVTLDQAGNIWMTNNGLGTTITEVVGAGVMIYQNYALGLQNGRFQTIA